MNMRRYNVPVCMVCAVAALAHSSFAVIVWDPVVADYGSASSPLATGSSESLSLNQFDTSLGTLSAMTITMYSSDTIASLVINATGSSALYSNATATVPVAVTAFEGLSTTATGTAGPFAGLSTAFGASVAGTDGVISAQDVVNVSPEDFHLYEGAGPGQFTFTVAVADSIGTYSGSGPSYLFFGGNGYSYGSIVVEYGYITANDDDPADPIPEPSTLCAGLAVISICGFGVARRFRRIPWCA